MDVSASPIILAEKSVSVAAPSSNERPLEKEMSKSLVSNDLFLYYCGQNKDFVLAQL